MCDLFSMKRTYLNTKCVDENFEKEDTSHPMKTTRKALFLLTVESLFKP